MALESLDAAAALMRLLAVADLTRGRQLPHLDRLVKTAADELPRVRRESNAVDAVLVAIGALEALEQVSHLHIPHPDTLIKRAGGDELSIGRDGDGRDTVLDGERQIAIARLQIPDPDGPIATAGSDGTSIAGEIQRVDILIVAGKRRADLPRGDVPNLDGRASSAHILTSSWNSAMTS